MAQIMEELAARGIQVMEEPPEIVPISVSARHVHLTRTDMDILFGKGSNLTIQKKLSQPGQFAANEKVTVKGPKGIIENVRVLGPLRSSTQIELSASDARRIGVQAVVRQSGDLEGTPGVMILGSAGSIETEKGCIIAERHIHMTPDLAEMLNLKNGQQVSVEIGGKRGGIFRHVSIRVRPDYAYDMHIDTDEANAYQIGAGTKGKIIYDDGKGD